MGRADAVREDERQAARGGLVHDDRPGLALREEREDVRGDVQLDDPLPLDVTREHEAHAEIPAPVARDAPAPARRPRERAAVEASPASATARTRTSSPFSGASRATDSTMTSSAAAPSALRRSGRRRREPRCASAANSSTSTVFAKTCTRSAWAPRATIEFRASVPVTRTPEAFVTIGGTTVPFTRAAPAGARPLVVALDHEHVRDVSQAAPGDRALRRERAPAGDDDDVRARARSGRERRPA